LVTNLVSQRNLKEVIAFLEREIARACKMEEHGTQGAITNEYRYLLIKSINQITQTYPETIPAVLSPLLQNFLRFEGKSTFTSLETILFIREVIEVHPEHRQAIFSKICSSFAEIKSHLVIRVALWIIGEYALSQPEVEQAFDAIKRNVGSLPVYPALPKDEDGEQRTEADGDEKKEKGPQIITKTVVLADGSYGTQTIVVDDNQKKAEVMGHQAEETYLPLRYALIHTEDDYLASCLAVSLTKLAIKAKKNLSRSFKSMVVDSVLILCALLKSPHRNQPSSLVQASSSSSTKKVKRADLDSMQRMQFCLKLLTQNQAVGSLSQAQATLVDHGRAIFAKFLETHSKLLPSNAL